MRRAMLTLIGLLMTSLGVADSKTVAVIGFGGGAMQYQFVTGTNKSSWESIPLPFDRLSVIRNEMGRVELFGESKDTNQLGLWENVGFGEWQFVRPVPTGTMALFAMGPSYGAIECDNALCSVVFYERQGPATGRASLPPGTRLRARSQPVWRSSTRTILLDTADDRIAEFAIDNRSIHKLTDGIHPAVSPDGSKLSFLRAGSIWIRELRDEREQELLSESLLSGQLNQTFFWSADGNSLYVNFETGYWMGDGYACTRVDAATGKKRRIWKYTIQCEAELQVAIN